ncbi:MAG: DegT/DnrJ/EryC1/StrS family aminotransferase [Nitrospirae bacterium]|nr:DegT/DnrJ/EryC1/StrS family aminotransferase [Nitrospirota bacterium]
MGRSRIRKVPPAAVRIRFRDILIASFSARRGSVESFRETLRRHFGRDPSLAGSGSAAFSLILRALKERSDRREVVLPAYTVPGLHLVVGKAGLATRLCDVDPDTLGYDLPALEQVVGRETLAVVVVHLFGFPLEVDAILRMAETRGAAVVEDAAQALGSRLRGDWAGRHGAASFFSFERGKNLSAYGGGSAVAREADLGDRMRSLEAELPARPFVSRAALPFLLVGLGMASRPRLYGWGYPFWRLFKSSRRHETLSYFSMDRARASLLERSWPRLEGESYRRMMNGRYLHAWLGKMKGVHVPRIGAGGFPAFTRLPVIIESLEKVRAVREDLWREGMDASVMFPRTVSQSYPEGFPPGREEFPHAEQLAPRLLTLPVHPWVRPMDLERMVSVFERRFGR